MTVRSLLKGILPSACLLLLIWITARLVLEWQQIPAQIPTNYDFDGSITNYSGKNTLLFLSAVNWGIFAVFAVILYVPGMTRRSSFFRLRVAGIGARSAGDLGKQAQEKHPEETARLTEELMMILQPLCTAILTYLTFCSMRGLPLAPWFSPVILTAMLLPTIVYTVRLVLLASH